MRSVRAVGAENTPALATMKRSMTAGQNTTSALSSKPAETAKLAERLAANSSALARAVLAGAALPTTSRANAAASAGTTLLCQCPLARATSGLTLGMYTEW